MRRLFLAFFIALYTHTTMAGPPKGLSQSLTGQARADYESGRTLFGDDDYKGAALKFRSAYETAKDARLLWNIAVCEKAQRHYARVQELVERYIAEGHTVISVAERKDAEELLKAVEPLVVKVQVSSDPAGASVAVDGEDYGTTPLVSPIRVDVGTHKFVLKKRGYRDFEQTSTLTAATAIVAAKLVAPQGFLEVDAPTNATVTIDGAKMGVGKVRLTLPVGVHALRVAAKDMSPYVSDVAIEDDRVRRLSVSLERDPGRGLPVWFWACAGVLAAGALTVSGYFIFRPSSDPPSPPSGTLDPGVVYSIFR